MLLQWIFGSVQKTKTFETIVTRVLQALWSTFIRFLQYVLLFAQTIQQTLSSARSSREESCYKHWTKTSIFLTTGAKLLHEAWLGKMTLSPTTKRLQQNVLTWRIKDNRQKLVHNFDRYTLWWHCIANLQSTPEWGSCFHSYANFVYFHLKTSAS